MLLPPLQRRSAIPKCQRAISWGATPQKTHKTNRAQNGKFRQTYTIITAYAKHHVWTWSKRDVLRLKSHRRSSVIVMVKTCTIFWIGYNTRHPNAKHI